MRDRRAESLRGAVPDATTSTILKTSMNKIESPTTPISIVGWREWLSLPELRIPGIKAKVDTGARSSALHTHDFELFERDGGEWVSFHLHPLPRTNRVLLSCEAPVLGFREVKDSGGHLENRPFIHTKARIGAHEWEIDISLTNREGMKFRMLLGREALAGGFLVNPSTSYLIGKSLYHEYRSKPAQ